jgi:hypothetical protein
VAAHLRAAVAGELDEVQVVRPGDGAREVGKEDEARLERADEERLPAGVVAVDLGAELADARGEVTRREVDLSYAGVWRVYDARSRWKC